MEHKQDYNIVVAENRRRQLKLLAAGTFAGATHITCMFPLDTIKTRLQVMGHAGNHSVTAYPSLYKGPIDCFSKTWRHEGFSGIYRGMSPFLLASTPLIAAGFIGFDAGKIMVRKGLGKSSTGQLTLAETTFSQLISVGVSSTLLAPAERIKCLIQVQPVGTPQIYKGPMDCAIKLLQQGGFANLYRGYSITCLRGMAQVSVYYPSINAINYLITPEGQKLSKERAFVAGVLAGMTVWTLILPIDGVKTILQTAPMNGTHPKTSKDIFMFILRNEGIPGLYRGLVPILMRSVVGIGAVFGGFNVAISAMSSE